MYKWQYNNMQDVNETYAFNNHISLQRMTLNEKVR